MKGRTKNRTTVGPLKNKNNETVTSSKEMAEELNNYFTSVFTREPVGPVPKPTRTSHQTYWRTSVYSKRKF